MTYGRGFTGFRNHQLQHLRPREEPSAQMAVRPHSTEPQVLGLSSGSSSQADKQLAKQDRIITADAAKKGEEHHNIR